MLTNSIKYTTVLSLFVAIIISYYTAYTFFAYGAPSGQINCMPTGTVKGTCCQEHIINRSPSNLAGTLVTYCTDCDIGPGGVYQNCGERYVQMFEQDPNPPSPPKPPFSERIPPGVIEQAQPLTQQNPNGINENVPPQQEFTEQLSASETLEGDRVADNEQDNDFSTQSEESDEDEGINDEQNDTNS